MAVRPTKRDIAQEVEREHELVLEMEREAERALRLERGGPSMDMW